MSNQDNKIQDSERRKLEGRVEMEARVLAQALPNMQRYADKSVVIKYGGHAMGDDALAEAFCGDVALIKQSGVNPVVVHGGGPQIATMLERVGIKSEFKNGLRITDEKTIEIVEMVLAGTINKSIVTSMNAKGARAIGLSGKDGEMVLVEKTGDLGFVGEPIKVNREVIDMVMQNGMTPIIAPVSPDKNGQTYNVNADTFAGAIAGALNATRLLFLTDVPGVLDKEGNLLREISVKQAKALIKDGTISGGMIPKVETSINVIENGVEGVVILNGKTPHAVLIELFTEYGAGTLIVKDEL
ncbi:MAG: acetylglutamate kinase [Rhizobiaceae bacterium]|nr:acetylglutamate kinase [Rhizobiaceae bacterium]